MVVLTEPDAGGDVAGVMDTPATAPARPTPRRPGALFGRTLRAARVLVAVAIVASTALPAVATTRVLSRSGVEVWLVPVAGAQTFTVRLGLGSGLGSEDSTTVGAAAAVAAWLRVGPTMEHAPGSLSADAARAGLDLSTELGWYDTALLLDGAADSLEYALWLTTTRLSAPPDVELPVDLLSGALWSGARSARANSVGFHGDAVEEVMAEVLGGDAGHTPTGSRRGAERFSPQRLEEHARVALRGPARLVVAASPAALERVRSTLVAAVDRTPSRPPPTSPRAGLTAEVRRARPPAVALSNPNDHRHHVVVAWDLRGAARGAALDLVERDVALATLEVMLGHPGSPLSTRLIRDDPVARSVRAHARDAGGTAVAIIAEVRRDDVGRARELILDEVEAISRPTVVGDGVIAGAARVAATHLNARWNTTGGRAALMAEIIASGRANGTASPTQWFHELGRRLADVRPESVRQLAAWGLVSSRRTLAEVAPEGGASQLPPGVGDDILETYLRITVDIRCPTGGTASDHATLLREKYAMDPRTYYMLTRALARRPHAMQGIQRAADDRCEAYRKLRGILLPERIVALHEAVACGPGRLPESAADGRNLQRIYRRFDIDASWYRPLVNMLREDMRHRDALAVIDARCPESIDAPGGAP